MKLSIVTTLYQSAEYIDNFHKRISSVAKKLIGESYEIIFVNDGSLDNSLDLAINISLNDDKTVVLDLSRNFGHHNAMMTGLAYSQGELIFLIDSDLEEDPEWLFSFLKQMIKDKSDVVYGVQMRRKGGLYEKISGWFFYKIFRYLTGLNQPDNFVTARLMSRRYVNALLSHNEREINIGGLWVVTGFQQSKQYVTKRATSPTTYSLTKKFSHLINAITSFSSLPLVFTFYSGLFISFSAGILISYLVLSYFIGANPPSGYLSMIASTWLFSGLIILFIGIQGIYISKIFLEVKQRPRSIIRQIYNGKKPD